MFFSDFEDNDLKIFRKECLFSASGKGALWTVLQRGRFVMGDRGFLLLKDLSDSGNADVGSKLRLFADVREAEEAVGKVLHHRQAHRLAQPSQLLGERHRVVQQSVQS